MQHKILSIIPTEPEMQNKFNALADLYDCTIDFYSAENINACNIKEYSVILGTPSVELIKNASNLQYLHLSMAGSNAYVADGVLPQGAILTNSTGAFGHAISEHMLAALFCLYKKLHLYRDNQNNSLWNDEGNVKSIYGSRCLVVGLGDIGSSFARLAHSVGMEVCGIRRTSLEKPDYISKMYSADDLCHIVGEFDVVALSLPETKNTINLFDKKMFSLMKNDAILINVGRGSAVNTDDLYEALSNNTIGGACLDVTSPEPLPSYHPLWKCKNAIITPHVSGFFHLRQTYDSIVKLAYENLQLYLSGKSPKNLVDFETGYRKP